MLLSPRKYGLTSLFKEVRVFKGGLRTQKVNLCALFSCPSSKFHFARLTLSYPRNTSVFLCHPLTPYTPPSSPVLARSSPGLARSSPVPRPFLVRLSPVPRPVLARSSPGPRPALARSSPSPRPEQSSSFVSTLSTSTSKRAKREIYYARVFEIFLGISKRPSRRRTGHGRGCRTVAQQCMRSLCAGSNACVSKGAP